MTRQNTTDPRMISSNCTGQILESNDAKTRYQQSFSHPSQGNRHTRLKKKYGEKPNKCLPESLPLLPSSQMAISRADYIQAIATRLSVLCVNIEFLGKLNISSLHNSSEIFYMHLLNSLFKWNLTDANLDRQNMEAIDLISHGPNKIVAQVSATCTKTKVESALSKQTVKDHVGYQFKFISISKDASKLRTKQFNNPHGISFDPKKDIFDIPSLLAIIRTLEIEELEEIHDFLVKEIKLDDPTLRLESNLTQVVNLLSKENLKDGGNELQVNSFDIDRKIEHNKLKKSAQIINDYKIHHGRLKRIYDEYDVMGANKSHSVLSSIRSIYLHNSQMTDDDALFALVIDRVTDIAIASPNLESISKEELDLCVTIIVVDAFIRCKIFEPPPN